MLDQEDPYIQFLSQRRGKRFCRKPYQGNSGDTLIQTATAVLFEQLGLEEVLDPRQADVIVYPGGAPTLWPQVMTEMAGAFARYPQAEFVIGPATFRLGSTQWPRVLNDGPVTGCFAREPIGLERLRQAGLRADIVTGLSHDVSLQLRGTLWLDRQREACADEYVLLAFRADRERAVPKPGRLERLRPFMPAFLRRALRRLDNGAMMHRRAVEASRGIAARHGNSLGVVKEDVSLLDFDSFLEAIRLAAEVHTDRLHVMLLAAMLDKPVYAYSTAYGKLETIIEYSLRPWAPVEIVSLAKS